MLRRMLNLSAWRDKRGKCSLRRTPGAAVWMVRKGPRYSSGASGFGSNVSTCDGPPPIHRTMQARAAGRAPEFAAWARARSKSGKAIPSVDRAPTLRKSRRL